MKTLIRVQLLILETVFRTERKTLPKYDLRSLNKCQECEVEKSIKSEEDVLLRVPGTPCGTGDRRAAPGSANSMGTARAVKAPHKHNQLCIHCSAAFIKHQVPFCSQEGEGDFKKEKKAPLHGSTLPRSWRMNLQPKHNLEQGVLGGEGKAHLCKRSLLPWPPGRKL